MQLACPSCGRTLQVPGEAPSFCPYCGRALARPELAATTGYVSQPEDRTPGMTPLPVPGAVPETVGSYRLVRPLGSGGMGSVFEAEETRSGRRVAINLLGSDASISEEALERFRQEGRLASAIAHPRCVFVLAADEEAGRPYIVMELMPGATLKDLVEQQGPLPPRDAITKILDVIEGLQEAHRRGVIHRDVKPSNCFLEPDGRVKVGDFGLAKSLAGDAHLTRTGAFLGTPLFASPEQIRRDPLTPQTDVYSVAATLYYLLTGRAPFQSGDAAATMARIVSDPVPSLRKLRTDIPPALDKVVLRGLERHRQRRWRDLEAFRLALVRFIPEQLSIAGMGLRLGAIALDAAVILLPLNGLKETLPLPGVTDFSGALGVLLSWVGTIAFFLYFAVAEGIWGCSLGKRLTRLRVCTPTGVEVPGLARILLRTLVFFACWNVASVAGGFLETDWDTFNWASFGVLVLAVAGPGILFSTMRARNGYRGLHELLTGTRVVCLPGPRRRPPTRKPPVDQAPARRFPAEGLPDQIGSFVVQEVLGRTDGSAVLAGEDASLARPVWIWLRAAACPPLSSARREVNRTSRLRWLAGGHQAEWQWEAFVAPAGYPLPQLLDARTRLSWAEARPILEELTEELAIAQQEATLPETLTVAQVWLQADGRVQLLDMSLTETGAEAAGPPQARRVLPFLHQVAVVALEGCPRAVTDSTPSIRAPLPGYAARLLKRLAGGQPAYDRLDQFRADLKEVRHRPAEVSRSRRFEQLLLAALFVWLGVVLYFGALDWFVNVVPSLAVRLKETLPGVYRLYGFIALCVLWAFLTREGLTLRFLNLALKRSDGRDASRFQCAWRALLFWVPLVLFLDLAHAFGPTVRPVWFAALGLPFLVYATMAIWTPSRTLTDRLAGTYLVPR